MNRRHSLRSLWKRITLMRYLAASSIAGLTDWTLYLMLAQRMVPELANAIAYGTAMLVNFAMHRRMVFRNARRGMVSSFLLSMSLSGIGLLLNTLTLYLVRLVLPDHLIVPKLVATGLVFIYNYFSKKHIAFGDRHPLASAVAPASAEDGAPPPAAGTPGA